MGSGQSELAGPDLRAGVGLEVVGSERPLVGHVDGEAVLLLRVAGEVMALGAHCTHYGGPLGEGLVTGEVIRCPWHHACFSLRTGEAVSAPALNPIPRWRTEQRDGVVYVLGREPEAAFAQTGRARSQLETVVVVGAGAAGHAATETLRREGYAGRLVVIDPDADAPYDRPNLSKDYLAGEAPEEWLPLRPRAFYAEHEIERLESEVTSLDPAARTITIADKTVIGYDAVLLALGAAPIRPRIEGIELPHVHVLRSLTDCREIMRAAMTAQRAVVAGASFIGMEAAASLRAGWGIDVTVVAPEAVPFEKSLGRELGSAVRTTHEQHGVRFRLGRTLREITAEHVVLDDGEQLPADLVLIGVGVRPRLELARAAGLEVADGVVVNQRLEASAPGVFAAGDIALYPNPLTGERDRIEHWVVAQRQGQTAARNMVGHREAFTSVPFFWSRHYDLGISYVGRARSWTHVEVDGVPSDGDCRVTYRDGTRLLAVATIDRDGESLRAEVELESASRAAAPVGRAGRAAAGKGSAPA